MKLIIIIAAVCVLSGCASMKQQLTGDPSPSLANVPGWTKFHEGTGWSFE